MLHHFFSNAISNRVPVVPQLQNMGCFCQMKTPGRASGWKGAGRWIITC